MKLLFCPKCQDVIKLITQHNRSCMCGNVSGQVLPDEITAEVKNGVPLGFNNYTFANALARRPQYGPGKDFTAFVIPKECPTVIVKQS